LADHPHIKRNILSILNEMRVKSTQVTPPWLLKTTKIQTFFHAYHMFINAHTNDHDLEGGGGPLEFFSRTTGGP
jgi:hypothetical protein